MGVTICRVHADRPPVPPRQPRWLIRLAAKLRRWERPAASARDLEPALVAHELLAWSRDDGRWHPRAKRDWHSLFDDVQRSWSRLGPRLTAVVAVHDELAALRQVRAASSISAEAHRSVVERAASALGTAFDHTEGLVAAADDLFEAAERSRQPGSIDEVTQWRLAVLASVGEKQGHDWAVIADRVRRALESTHDKETKQSIEAVHRSLCAPAGEGRSVVWLTVDYAWASG